MKVEHKASKLMMLNNEIAIVDQKFALSDEWLTTILLDSMPKKYDMAVSTFRMREAEEGDIFIKVMLFLRSTEETFACCARK